MNATVLARRMESESPAEEWLSLTGADGRGAVKIVAFSVLRSETAKVEVFVFIAYRASVLVTGCQSGARNHVAGFLDYREALERNDF